MRELGHRGRENKENLGGEMMPRVIPGSRVSSCFARDKEGRGTSGKAATAQQQRMGGKGRGKLFDGSFDQSRSRFGK